MAVPPRRKGAVIGLAVAVVLAVVVGGAVVLSSRQQPEGPPVVTSSDLTDAQYAVIERAIIDDQFNVGAAKRTGCGVRVYGYSDSANARTFWGTAGCSEYDQACEQHSSFVAPFAAELVADRATIEMPRDGAAYSDDIKRIFPGEFERAAVATPYELSRALGRTADDRAGCPGQRTR